MKRSTIGIIVMLALGMIAAPLASGAQLPAKVPRIGWLSDGVGPEARLYLHESFLQGLRDLGYVEGQNIVIERRDAEGTLERLPDLAVELARLKVDVIVTRGVPGTGAAKRVTSSIPIVMVEAGDPVGTGLVSSLARPGGNVTGLSAMSPDIAGKRLQLLQEATPKISRVAVLYNPTFSANVLGMREAQAAGPALGLTILPMEVRASD